MIVNLISGPRNISTALMYSFAQRPDTQVVDEPFYAYYLDQNGVAHPGRDLVLQSQPTDSKSVINDILKKEFDNKIIFLKNMAHHITDIDYEYFSEFINIFLIREPGEMLSSFIKKIPNPTLSDTAYKSQYELFKFVKETRQPLVIDSAELLKNPKFILSEVCKKSDIPFSEKMLQWDAGPIPEDGVWAKYWYGNVHESTGFKPYMPKKTVLPHHLHPLLKKCRNYYKELYKSAIKAPQD